MSWFYQYLYDICTTQSSTSETLRAISGVSNLMIGLAYYWIPANMAIVFYRHRNDLLYPWLWLLFIVFIALCGTTHIAHVIHINIPNQQTLYNEIEVGFLVITAVISIITAIAFSFVLPKIMRIASPKLAKNVLQNEIKLRTDALEEALQKEKLLTREVHHRVKNNLQVIASLINMHMRDGVMGESTLQDLRDRIAAISAVHNQLQAIEATNFDLNNFINGLCSHFSVLHKRQGVKCFVNTNDYVVSFYMATPFSLLVNEVISNIFKHGFYGIQSGRIDVSMETDDKGVSVLRISDNGIGMIPSSKRGVGLTLIHALSVQLNATPEWHSTDLGTEFVLTIRPQEFVENSA